MKNRFIPVTMTKMTTFQQLLSCVLTTVSSLSFTDKSIIVNHQQYLVRLKPIYELSYHYCLLKT